MKKIKLVVQVPVVIEVEVDRRREILIEDVLPELKNSGGACWSSDFEWSIRTDKITRKQVLDALRVAENKRAR